MNGKLLTLALALAFAGCAGASAGTSSSTRPGATAASDKIAAQPLYRDPVYGYGTDPVFTYNAETKRWLMYYTQRRGPSIALIHGTKIGIAASEDNGATWKYIGTADITYGQKEHPKDYTYWAPEVIWAKGQYHMYLAFVPGIFSDWNHHREIGHITSHDGIHWTTVGKIDLKSNKVIDPCVIQLPNGVWRMFYKDEASRHNVNYADSTDLYHWSSKGPAVTDRNGEGEKCFHWQGKYWLMADTDRPQGQAVWSSDDCTHWTPQASTIFGSHGDVVINPVTQRAWWFYFGGQRPANQNWAMVPDGQPLRPPATGAEPATSRPAGGRGIAINVVELKVIDGKLMFTNPGAPTPINLGNQREVEK